MALVINGQRIDDAVIDAEFGAIKSYHESLGNVSCCERDPEFRESAKQNIVARVLLAQEAARSVEPTPQPQLDAAVEKLKEEYGGEGWFFARTGATAETMHLVRKDVDLDLRARRLMRELGEAGGPPAEADLRRFYDENLQWFMTPEAVRASHILKTGQGKPGTPPESREQYYDRLRQVRRDLLKGADFEAAAREHSDRADENIDLGFFKRNELAPEVEAVAFSMEIGEISPIFVSPHGLHLIKLTDRRPSVAREFDEAKADVERLFVEQRRQERARELVERLKGDAKVEEIDEYAEVPEAMQASVSAAP
jgi:parvulin-like peptidyl-prolyl isomerase